jgi:pyrroline-5-carboxylate reductase
MMKAVCEALRPSLKPGQLVVSIAAGITCASMNKWLGEHPIVRCMPNTPALLRQGVSGLYATARVSSEQREQAGQLLSAVGIVLWLDAQLTLQTALGAALMATGSDVDAAELRRRVTSPAGTTEAAIKSFQAGGFEALVETALTAAAHRSAEMAEQLGQ